MKYHVEYTVNTEIHPSEWANSGLPALYHIPSDATITYTGVQPDPGWYQSVDVDVIDSYGLVEHWTPDVIASYINIYGVEDFRRSFRRVNEPTAYTGVLDA